MIKKTSSNQPCGRDFEYIIAVILKSFSIYNVTISLLMVTQVNRMSRSRRVLAIGGKQRILRLDMVCIETILFHLDSL